MKLKKNNFPIWSKNIFTKTIIETNLKNYENKYSIKKYYNKLQVKKNNKKTNTVFTS
ncbi:Hypothetical Protein SLY_0651 [Strawberry lethal yellows phytoplasma (CPA) str. NZSb11]|uniref:Uncharacterized protein n=1 Tax=Strawberry lethal yellows phytoplasma (CPA) str. NZSb11 TaxID=980422 RepID=R4RXF1_PHYAS|nr:Hypothetical Protein SLY_0651 [Strawberry lethal yellows phytoplasma (CPA) str. NZSb11]